MNDAPFGFAQGVTGGGVNTVPTRVRTAAELRSALEVLTFESPPTVIELMGVPSDENAFDFGSGKGKEQQINITARALTIRAFKAALLKNVKFVIDCDASDNVLISGLSFHSEGAADGARDTIDLDAVGSGVLGLPAPPCRVRISHCSFDGYYDISICSKSIRSGPRLLVTIDHCLFFDARPGLQGPNDSDGKPATYVNRGAINFATEVDKAITQGNAFVTVAYNAFIDVWRRSPRVARGNRMHVFNNILYRWGYTDPTSADRTKPNGTWRGMEIGGGKNSDPTDDGTALLQANRFIPWVDKQDPSPEIKIHPNTHVDLKGMPPKRNEFDTPGGKPIAEGQPVPTVPDDREAQIDPNRFYGDLGLGLVAPDVVAMGRVNWEALVRDAGPANFLRPGFNPRAELLALLQNAGNAQ